MKKLYLVGAACALLPTSAFAATYQVGPNKPYASLQELETVLEPGDLVEVDGDATYGGNIWMRRESSGAPGNPVVIRGIRKNGKRPVIQGGSDWGIMLNNDHVVFEGFEVTGSSFTCVINKGHDITLRDTVVHDCPGHGILGMDFETGDQTMEFIEVYACGDGIYDHQIYVATDETEHPGSRVRLQHSYVHDGNGGNNFKSRAERNEVYYNWLEAPAYHVFDIIGADGQDPELAREDTDVVGNVLIQTGDWTIARIGGDGTGASSGRYRFAYNTVVVSPNQGTMFRVMDEIESLALHDNAFLLPDGGSPDFIEDEDAVWTTGSPKYAAQNNFVQSGISAPSFFSGTVSGADAALTDYAAGNFVPTAPSPLVDAGAPGSGPSGYELPNPLLVPLNVPPVRSVDPSLTAHARPSGGTPDIGAYEVGSPGDPSGTTSSSTSGGGETSSSGSGAGGEDGGAGLGDDDGGGAGGGCSCSAAPTPSSAAMSLIGAGLFAAALRGRRRRAISSQGR
jgi:MYXO-CTERM domain-containing protein